MIRLACHVGYKKTIVKYNIDTIVKDNRVLGFKMVAVYISVGFTEITTKLSSLKRPNA